MAEPNVSSVGGIRIIDTPDGNSVTNPNRNIEFTSSDDSITITGDEVNKRVDFITTAATDVLSMFVDEEVLSGIKNGINMVFTTVNKFRNIATGLKPKVYLNGQRLKQTDDYTVSSSDANPGYDIITLLYIAPTASENLIIDYVKV